MRYVVKNIYSIIIAINILFFLFSINIYKFIETNKHTSKNIFNMNDTI